VERFITKLGSGKFFTTVAVVTTYCFAIIGCVVFTAMGWIAVETLLALFAGFSAIAGMIVEGYFHKSKDKEAGE
jgi:hypothetical protein